jgi:methylated-DNA-[protein]-cysteine S-methyltransferase
MLTLAVASAAAPALAQPSGQQAVRPQPPPAAKPATQPDGKPAAAPPQTSKPEGTQAAKPAPGSPQSKGAKTPPPKKPAPPRTSKVWKGRGFAAVSAGAQLAAPGYTSTAVFKVHAEDATLNADATIGIGPAFGARGGVRVWKNLAIGAGLEVTATSQRLNVTGLLPHPFQFNQYREVDGTASGLSRAETLVAFEVSWYAALARRVDMIVFAGPAYINVRQDMATRIQFTESYPFETATFTGVETTSVSGGAIGVTAGVDVSYLVTRQFGIGGDVRYLRVGRAGAPQPARGLRASVRSAPASCSDWSPVATTPSPRGCERGPPHPAGPVCTYGDVAALRPPARRAVGNIMRGCGAPGTPCHRVVAAGGRLGGFGANPAMKRALLAAEGVTVAGGRIREWRLVRWQGWGPDRRTRNHGAAESVSPGRRPPER